MSRSFNFSAGPSALPLSVLETARDELVDFEGSGMSVMEQSHRGKVYEKVHYEATALVAKHLGLSNPSDWAVLFLQGGASTIFATLPLNLLPMGRVADYVVTGTWGEKAVAEARAARSLGGGQLRVAASSAPTFSRVPRQAELAMTPNATYLHLTSNETCHGVQFACNPSAPFVHPTSRDVPVVVDMSSDIFGRVVDVESFGMVYAGAQKNVGPSGVTLVVIKKEILERCRVDLPAMFGFRTHAEHDSLYNTPSTFGVYLVSRVLRWLDAQGGVSGIEVRNREKARLIYDAIERFHGFYTCPVEVESRSIMNVVWRLPTPELEALFVKEAESHRMIGLKGHRSVGGIRASLYNAVETSWAQALASFMDNFAKRYG